MRIIKFLKYFIISLVCVFCIYGSTYAAGKEPLGDIGEYGAWINKDNMTAFSDSITSDMENFHEDLDVAVTTPGFVPVEVKLGLMLMKAFYSIDQILQLSLVRFTIIFLFIMYAFWIALEAYKMIRETNDYKEVMYNIFKKGFIIAIWVMVLNYGTANLFTMIIGPIISIGTYLSDFILNVVAKQYDIKLPDTCMAVHQFVEANNQGKLLIDAETAANIMCLPSRISTYFYHAISTGFKWMGYGFTHSITAIVLGGVFVYVFIKCTFKYAFMTLGVVTDLFLTLLMLPFTAVAEAMPQTKETNYASQIFNGFLKIFNTKKLSDVILVFVNAAIYFISLSIVISICAALLSNIISLNSDHSYSIAAGMTALLTGGLVLHLANQTDELTKKLGGSIDNSFGKELQNNAKVLWNKTKKMGSTAFKNWMKK